MAGELCVVARLASAETGDALSEQRQPLAILPWQLPEPQLPIAVRAATRNDEDGLAKALGRLSAADPALRIERNADTGQLVLWCLGEAHADVVMSRLRAGAAVQTEPVRISLLATFTAKAAGHGRLVKQSGGHGQYAVCDVEVEPLPRGSGVEFVDRVVGGAVPQQLHRLGGEGRPAPAGTGRGRHGAGHRRPGHPAGRQGAQRRLLGRRVPGGRRAGGQGRRQQGRGAAAGAGGGGAGHGVRRPDRLGAVATCPAGGPG